MLTVAAAATVSRNQNASACLLDASALASKQVSVNCGVIVKRKVTLVNMRMRKSIEHENPEHEK